MIYEYLCPDKHLTEKIRKVAERHDPLACKECGKPASLTISLPHCMPDGIYSYAPNNCDANTFERKYEAAKAKRLSNGQE